jgi:hypothetical protein
MKAAFGSTLCGPMGSGEFLSKPSTSLRMPRDALSGQEYRVAYVPDLKHGNGPSSEQTCCAIAPQVLLRGLCLRRMEVKYSEVTQGP